jgi:predicted amidohydrolase YtcJ
MSAATVLLGQVWTGNPQQPRAEGLAIDAGKILAVGSRAQMQALADKTTQVHDLADAFILPGFIDVHAHLDTEGLLDQRPSLSGAKSIADIQARIRELAARTPKGEWIVTMPVGDAPFYFDATATLAEGRMPNRQELDAAAPEHPVCIFAPSGYWSLPPCHTVLNSLGLARNGLDRHSQARLAGLQLERDTSGELTGVLTETNLPEAMQLDLLPAVPRFTREDRLQAVRRAMRRYHACGTTSIFEGHGCAAEVIDVYRSLHERGELTMRASLVVSPAWRDTEEAARMMRHWMAHAAGNGLGDETLRVAGVFIAFGGDAQAACMQQHQHPEDIGFWNNLRQANDAQTFEELCLLAAQANLRVHTIVVDQLHELLPVLERINAKFPLAGRRWVLEHMSVVRQADLERLARLRVGVTLIPDFHLWKAGYQRYRQLDAATASMIAPVKNLLALGIPVGAGTDASPCDPLALVRSMVSRRERVSGSQIGADGCIGVEQALRVITAGGAWFTGDEQRKGKLQAGYFADIAVLENDPFTMEVERLPEVERLATLVGGRLVHGAF